MLSTADFIKELNKLNYKVTFDKNIISVDKEDAGDFSMNDCLFIDDKIFLHSTDEDLSHICQEYQKTLQKMIKQEKFYIKKVKFNFYDDKTKILLSKNVFANIYSINTPIGTYGWQFQFSEQEIEEIKKEQDTDLSEFEFTKEI